MPYKTFLAGEEALANDVNTYLMSQAVARFSTAAARAAAIPTPTKGQCSTRDDLTGAIEIWDGGAWVATGTAMYLFNRTYGAGIGSGGSVPYDLNVTAPVSGNLIVESFHVVSYSSGPGPNLVAAGFATNAGAWLPPAAAHDSAGQIVGPFSATTMPCRALYTGITRGQALTLRLYSSNVGGGATVVWDKLSGIFYFTTTAGVI